MKSIKLKQDMEKIDEFDGLEKCTCKIDKEGKLKIDNKCYWHRK